MLLLVSVRQEGASARPPLTTGAAMFSFRILLRAALVVALIDGVAAGAAAQTACPPPTPTPTVSSSPTQPPRTQPAHVPTVTQEQLEEVQQYEPDLTCRGYSRRWSTAAT